MQLQVLQQNITNRLMPGIYLDCIYICLQQEKVQYFHNKNSFGCTHELHWYFRGSCVVSRQDGSVSVSHFRFTSRYSCLSSCPAEVCCFASQTALPCKHFGSYQPCQEADSLLLCLYIKLYSENGNIWNTNALNKYSKQHSDTMQEK